MNVVHISDRPVRVRSGSYRLEAFDPALAATVAGWVEDADELFWLAPRTEPPLTAAKVVAWIMPDGCPLLMYRHPSTRPLGYVELNPMPGQGRHLWLGHCLIRPEYRGAGLGRLMVELLLAEAFHRRRAGSVSLVVFPDNLAAIRCYRAAGFLHVGEQLKYFTATGRQHALLEMRISAERYAAREGSSSFRPARPRPEPADGFTPF